MKKLLYLTSLFAALVMVQTSKVNAQQNTYPVLLELFSSEGCESCPYADEFMQEVMALADSSNSPVFVIDYHVDIWNRSGWYDSSSTPEFSKRQTDYMKKVGQAAMFTPMLYINGQYGVPATNKKFVGQAIFKELVTEPKLSLSINAAMLNNGRGLSVSYNLSKKIDSVKVVLVLTKRQLKRNITAGENKGKILTHHNVAEFMYEIPITSDYSGLFQIPVDPNMDLSDYQLVGFVQQVNSWRVLAIDQIYFKSKE